jgi:NitT/TauT family transport system substrate-binding protein
MRRFLLAAAAKGFYANAGLDVTISPGGPDISPAQVIAGGGADVIVDWMASALAARDKGVPLVNIAQIFEKSGMELTCRKDSGVASPAQLKRKTLSVWFSGNEYPFLAWMAKLKLPISGGPDGVTVLKQGFNVDPLLQKQHNGRGGEAARPRPEADGLPRSRRLRAHGG